MVTENSSPLQNAKPTNNDNLGVIKLLRKASSREREGKSTPSTTLLRAVWIPQLGELLSTAVSTKISAAGGTES